MLYLVHVILWVYNQGMSREKDHSFSLDIPKQTINKQTTHTWETMGTLDFVSTVVWELL